MDCYLKHSLRTSLACTPMDSASAQGNAVGTDCQADLCQGCIGGLACQGLGQLFQGAGPCEHLLWLQGRRDVQAERWELLLACSNTLAAMIHKPLCAKSVSRSSAGLGMQVCTEACRRQCIFSRPSKRLCLPRRTGFAVRRWEAALVRAFSMASALLVAEASTSSSINGTSDRSAAILLWR